MELAQSTSKEVAETQRRLLAVIVAIAIVGSVVTAIVVATIPSSSDSPTYVEYGEPQDRPYVVLRVYGESTHHVNDTVRAEVVLVNPWEWEGVAHWPWNPPVSFLEVVSENGTSLFSWGSLDDRTTRTFSLAPGEEVVLMRALWLPTTVDLQVVGYHVTRIPEDPAPFNHGSLFCNGRTEGEVYTLAARVRGFSARNASRDFDVGVPSSRFHAPVTFHGVLGPCLAERPPTLDLRVDRTEAGLNESVRIVYVLVNQRDEWLNVSVDYAPVLSLEIAAENGSVVFAPDRAGISTRFPVDNVSFSLPPGGEVVLAEIWWNETSLWASPPHFLGLSFWDSATSADLRQPNETFTVTGHIGWLTVWEGAPYDWDGTPIPGRAEPQASQVEIRFV